MNLYSKLEIGKMKEVHDFDSVEVTLNKISIKFVDQNTEIASSRRFEVTGG